MLIFSIFFPVPGQKVTKVVRSSTDSSVIKPPFLTIDQIIESVNLDQETDHCCPRRYCECGWPPRLLIPRGTEAGMTFDLFVMATDWSADNATDDLDRGTSYCGVSDGKYPDNRAMGFPFDRKIDHFDTIDDFANHFVNMKSGPITIKYNPQAKSD